MTNGNTSHDIRVANTVHLYFLSLQLCYPCGLFGKVQTPDTSLCSGIVVPKDLHAEIYTILLNFFLYFFIIQLRQFLFLIMCGGNLYDL